MHHHRILIVEDHDVTRAALGTIFSRMGWFVRLAATVTEGADWINSGHEPCCLMLDLNLPDGDGESVLELARRKGLRTYIAVCTGTSDEDRLERVKALKPDAVLMKPITIDDVHGVVCPLIDAHDGSTDDMPTVK